MFYKLPHAIPAFVLRRYLLRICEIMNFIEIHWKRLKLILEVVDFGRKNLHVVESPIHDAVGCTGVFSLKLYM